MTDLQSQLRKPMTPDTACRRLVDEFRSRQTVRAGSLITTVFGDAIAPRGGRVWLGSLIKLMNEFGISERLVRTSVFRLVKDGWLQSNQSGRRSYYSLTDSGRQRFEVATHRIYAEPAANWDGRWTLLLLSGLETADKEVARRDFGWLGFGALSANLLAHPAPDESDLKMTVRRLGLDDTLVILSGETVDGSAAMRAQARSAWNLDDIDRRYEDFVAMFSDALKAVAKANATGGKTAFILRTLLIQEYRKILLRDPQLPAALLPSTWHGRSAYQLCVTLYRDVFEAADGYLTEVMETEHGVLPKNEPQFFSRFGGLEAS
ncbi:MAG: phenylacetic acid degradation operon negative regulatory protein PaaX [Woeseiaceae bacterium]|nr:phenylacetic acid degradation operon negative regulatory protein PaaX [Woeseiaceae bacterium]